MISGNAVMAETSVTATPALRKASAEPPVERISTPWPLKNFAKASSPFLSKTEISARRMGRSVMSLCFDYLSSSWSAQADHPRVSIVRRMQTRGPSAPADECPPPRTAEDDENDKVS